MPTQTPLTESGKISECKDNHSNLIDSSKTFGIPFLKHNKILLIPLVIKSVPIECKYHNRINSVQKDTLTQIKKKNTKQKKTNQKRNKSKYTNCSINKKNKTKLLHSIRFFIKNLWLKIATHFFIDVSLSLHNDNIIT